ncbi:MAG: hypothetical protein U0L08_05920 [Bacteroidales bacterium]|nr:hypothetical protein [Bacteroidales bacterium]
MDKNQIKQQVKELLDADTASLNMELGEKKDINHNNDFLHLQGFCIDINKTQ